MRWYHEKNIITFVIVLSLFMFLLVQVVSATDTPEIDETTIKDLWDEFALFPSECYPLMYFYDVDDYQNGYPHVVFDRDSNGQPYANGKKYEYMVWKDKDLSNTYEHALEHYKQVMTDELAERMAQDYHVSGGPDVEMVRQGEDGTWYKLSMIKPYSASFISDITVDGSRATAILHGDPFWVDYIYRTEDIDYRTVTFTVELECVDGKWKFSGGSVFDYLRNYAETSPYTGDESDTTLGALAAGAIIAALIPAALIIPYRRKKRFEA